MIIQTSIKKKKGIEKIPIPVNLQTRYSSGTYLLYKFFESIRFMHGQMSQWFTIQINAFLLQTVY